MIYIVPKNTNHQPPNNSDIYWDEEDVTINPPIGNAQIYIEDHNNVTVGSGHKVFRYDSGYNYIDWDETNSSGYAYWSDIPADTYNFEAYTTYYQSLWGDCYWGAVQGTVTSGNTMTETITQYEPFIESFTINGSSFIPGSIVHVDLSVRNNGTETRQCKAEIRIDGDQSSPWEHESGFHGPETIAGNGGVGYFGFDWTIPSVINPGTYYVTARVQSYIYSGYTNTDAVGWNESFDIEDISQQTIQFAGLTWNVRNTYGGPGPNNWTSSSNSVWVDNDGNLHLKIRKLGDNWYCSEVWTDDSFGYGEYKFYVSSNVENYDENIVCGLFTYLTDNDEIDIEFSRWGDPGSNAGWYVVQPSCPGNYESFPLNLTGDFSTHRFIWGPTQIKFESWHGHYDEPPQGNLIHEWTYTGDDIPDPGNEKLHLNFWLMNGIPPSNQLDAELVISDFAFNSIPVTPTPIFPPDGEIITTLTPYFEWSPFQDGGDGETQAGYQFRVRSDEEGDLIVYDTGFLSSTTSNSHTYSPGSYFEPLPCFTDNFDDSWSDIYSPNGIWRKSGPWPGAQSSYIYPENVSVQNGKVILTVPANELEAGQIETVNSNYHYGYYEARIKTSSEPGVVNAFFMWSPSGDNNEIDIEFLSNEFGTNTGIVHFVLHPHEGLSEELYHRSIALPFNPSDNFNNYAFNWKSNLVEFYINGELVQIMQSSEGCPIPDNSGAILLSNWSGGDPGWGGGPPLDSAIMEVDWVRSIPENGEGKVSLPLEWDSHYHWHVRYQDSGGDWSEWSADEPGNYQDFYTPIEPIYTISGYVDFDGNPLEGVEIVTGVFTDIAGTYSFEVNEGDYVTLTPTKVGYDFTPQTVTFTNIQNDIVQNFTADEWDPEQPINPVPTGTDVSVNVAQLDWDAPPSGVTPTKYIITLSVNPDYSNPIIDTEETSNTFYNLSAVLPLNYEQDYYAKVVPNYTAPVKGFEIKGNGPALEWNFTTEQCLEADFNFDGYVDAADLQLIGDHWHLIDTDPLWDPLYDLMPDGIIDAADLQVFGDHWHEGTPPKSGEGGKDGKGPNGNAGIVFDLDATTYGNQNLTCIPSQPAGTYIRVDVYCTGVQNLDTYEFEVIYDPTEIEYVTATSTNPITFEPNILTTNGGTALGWMIDTSTPGVLSIAYTLTGTDTTEAPEGEGLVADIVFQTLTTEQDIPTLTFGDVYFYDSFGVMDIITNKGTAKFTTLPPDPPENVIIYINSDSVYITWDTVPGCTYNLYSSTDPYATKPWLDVVTGINDTSWSAPLTDEKKFYYVTAVESQPTKNSSKKRQSK